MKHLLPACALLFTGCGLYRYTPTTQNLATPRSPPCAFDLLSAPPHQPFVEMGVLEVVTSPAYSADSFKNSVAEDVCKAGGDAVLTQVNGAGNYIRGTVIKFTAASDGARPASATPAPATPPPGTPAPTPVAVPTTAKRDALVSTTTAEIRTAPHRVAPVLVALPSGQPLLVSADAKDGWRIAMLPDGRVGYVQEAQIRMVP